MVTIGSWTATSVPSTTSVTLPMTTTAGSNTATVTGCNAVLAGAPVIGPNVAPGTSIISTACTSVTLSQPATVTGSALHTFTLPAYANANPPENMGLPGNVNCSVCPAAFTATMCAGQYFSYYMCTGHAYTISMCSSPTEWDSYLAITTSNGLNYAPGATVGSDNGCGGADGHASLTYIPTTTGIYRVRLWEDPCLVNAGLCGTVIVTCNTIPIGMADQAANAVELTVLPNPAQDRLELRSAQLRGAAITISDLSGRVVLHKTALQNDREVLDSSEWTSGTYVVLLRDAEGRRTARLFVKE